MSLLSVVLAAATPHNSDPLPWQTSLSTCWTNASCNRALIVGHGGDPNFVTLPYTCSARAVLRRRRVAAPRARAERSAL